MRLSASRRAIVVAGAVTAAILAQLGSAGLYVPVAHAATSPGTNATRAERPGKAHAPVPLRAGDALAIAVGQGNGVSVLVPNDPQTGGWRQVAFLTVSGWEAPAWTSESCLTGDGAYLAVAYAPINFANTPELLSAGAMAAVVNLKSGSVYYVPQRVALSYNNPSCGTDDVVAFTRYVGVNDSAPTTEIMRVSAVQRAVLDTRQFHGEVASVVPTGGSVVGTTGNSLVQVAADGSVQHLVDAASPIYDVHAASHGGVDYLLKRNSVSSGAYERDRAGRIRHLADGPLTNLTIEQGRAGANQLAGDPTHVAKGTALIAVSHKPTSVSLDGSAVVTSVGDDKGAANADVAIVTQQGSTSSTASTSGVSAFMPSQAVAEATTSVTAAAVSTSCAVARLAPSVQVIQPSNAEVQWAATRATTGGLTTARPANWQKHGLPAYTPQGSGTFPLTALQGGGHVPAQVLEGVLAQESNFSQASWHARNGIASDPLIADYYGVTYAADGTISTIGGTPDCGYGLSQVTDNMTAEATGYSANQKLEIATDYEANIAAGLNILIDKWNTLYSLGLTVNDGKSAYVENWYYALWAYNTGIHAATGSDPRHGLGWTNNPIRAAFEPNRAPFLSQATDAATPQLWPYQERVFGWAQFSQVDPFSGGTKFLPVTQKLTLPSDFSMFCNSSDECNPAAAGGNYCTRADSECWWHTSVTWASSDSLLTPGAPIATTAVEPTVVDPYPPSCSASASPVVQTPGTTALPSNAVIVDEIVNTSTNVAGCGTTTSAGTFTIQYGTTAVADMHQLGVGYGGHIWFTHSQPSSRTQMLVTGTWTGPAKSTGWQRVWVHLPENGAFTFQADYSIRAGTAVIGHRVVNQHWNQDDWFDLGSFNFGTAVPSVVLTNVTRADYSFSEDVAWDAVAFSPSSKPTVAQVSLGDSYSAGEGLGSYWANSDNGSGTADKDGCHRSSQAYPALTFTNMVAKHPGVSEFHDVACSGAEFNEVTGTISANMENPQLTTGWLDKNTTLVTVGIGGNDAHFAPILKACLLSGVAVTTSGVATNACVLPTYILAGDQGPLVSVEPSVIDSLNAKYIALFNLIHQLAPAAKVISLAYPHVVTTGPQAYGLVCSTYQLPTRNYFATWTDRLDANLAAVAAGLGVTVVDPRTTFTGHEACGPSAGTSTEWINGVVNWSNSGSGWSVVGTGSFHPKAAGHSQEAALIKKVLP